MVFGKCQPNRNNLTDRLVTSVHHPIHVRVILLIPHTTKTKTFFWKFEPTYFDQTFVKMAAQREAKKKKTLSTEGKKVIAIHKKKIKPTAKHEAPSSTSTDGMNRKERRRHLKEQGLLVERNVGKRTSVKAVPHIMTAAQSASRSAAAKLEQGEKIYACLHTNCNETFEGWMPAKRHMNNCKVEEGEKNYEGKPKISASRKKGNQLLASGVAAKKEYPALPTDATELVKVIRDFYKNSKTPTKKMDESFIMRRVIRPTWGSELKDFDTLGFGTWEEFVDANDISQEDSEVDSGSEESE